jgi:hypothetical protein
MASALLLDFATEKTGGAAAGSGHLIWIKEIGIPDTPH